MAKKVVRESKLERKQVKLAVPALLKYVEQKRGKQMKLLNESDTVWLVLSLKKIPEADKKPRKIPIPHSVYPEDREVCLITKEEGSKVKENLKLKGVSSISKVISLEKLKKKYKSFQSKRELANQYDVFLCDDRIYHLLPRLLGKAFFSKKKFPVPFDMKRSNLNGEINKILQCTFVSLGHGPCSAIRVAHTGQTEDQAVSNIVNAVGGLSKLVPRGWNNIKSLHIKTCDSISLPIYNSLPENPTSISVEPPRKKRKSDQSSD